MAELELPALAIESVAATIESARPLLINRSPGPDETDVPIGSTIALELVDWGTAGIDLAATRVWVDGALAFDGAPTPPFAGGRAAVEQTSDALRLVLDPVVPFASLATVTVRVVSDLVGGGFPLDQAYSFQVEDRTAPKLLAAIALEDGDGSRVRSEALREPVHMFASLRQHDRVATFRERANHIFEDRGVSSVVGRELGVDLRDGRLGFGSLQSEPGLAHDQLVLEWPGGCEAAWVHLEANGPELHAHDRLVAVAALRCRGESDHVARAHFAKHSFEGYGRFSAQQMIRGASHVDMRMACFL